MSISIIFGVFFLFGAANAYISDVYNFVLDLADAGTCGKDADRLAKSLTKRFFHLFIPHRSIRCCYVVFVEECLTERRKTSKTVDKVIKLASLHLSDLECAGYDLLVNSKICYHHKNILAPMVRIGALPMRLLALDYGADLVYSEEIIDHKLVRCQRRYNELLETVDFVDVDEKVVFRTCDREKGKIVLQIGTCDAERALKVAKLVENDVSGIDINMGCPKDFSLKGGMGAALLKQPDKIQEIVSTLAKNVSIPITCKMRVLPTVQATIEVAKLIESSDAYALAVHGRTKEERPQHPNRNEYIRAITKCISIPVIANGASSDILCYEDIEKFRVETNASAVMVARAAQNNCSIFRKEGLLEIDQVIRDYLLHAIKYENHLGNAKYCVQRMLGSLQASEKGKACNRTQSLQDLWSLWSPNRLPEPG